MSTFSSRSLRVNLPARAFRGGRQLVLSSIAALVLSGCEHAALEPPTPAADLPASLALGATSLSLAEGDTIRVPVILLGVSGQPISSPSSGRPTGTPRVAWSSSDPAVLAVDGSGLVRARRSGTAVLSATAGALGAKASVRVGSARKQTPAEVVVTPAQDSVTALGATVQLTATARDASGAPISNPSFTWMSLQPEVASVDASGRVTARAVGLALVTAVAGGVADTAALHVRQVVASVSVSPASATVGVGDTLRLSATPVDRNGFAVAGAPILWSSSDPNVSPVSGSGRIEGRSAGSAVVTAESHGVRGSASVTVRAPAGPDPCDALSFERRVPVATASELRTALSAARPGDQIRLADGEYRGRFLIAASGTAAQPISLCGGRGAVIDGGSVSEERAAIYHTASHWVLAGFTIRNAKRAILAERANHNVFRDLEIFDIGQEAIHLRVFSSHNTVERSTIRNTGLIAAEWGEGVYIGSWNGHWCTFTGCNPDRSDFNRIQDNTFGPGVAAEHIDAKEGTTGGLVAGNRFDGTGMVPSQPWIDSWVLVQGNGYTVRDNVGAVSLGHGFKTEVMLEGWGADNTFTGNVADVQGPGFGFRIGAGATGNVVACANTVRNAAMGFATVKCR